MAPASAQPHALVVSWPGHGHITAHMQFAKYLSSHGFAITFVYFARPFSLMQRKEPVKSDPGIRIEVVADGLPPDDDNIDLIFGAFGAMQEGLEQLVEKLNKEGRVTCIVSDTFLFWTQDVADKFGIPRVDFCTSPAAVYWIGFHLPQLISKGYLPLKGSMTSSKSMDETLIDFIPGLPPFPMSDLPVDYLVEDLSNTVFQFFLRVYSRVKEAERILIHSLYELESSAFDALRADRIPVYSVGPLFVKNGTPAKAAPASPLHGDEECLRWLDSHAISSVIYVSFGSFRSLSSEETRVMALGLEASKQPFLWVIRSESVKGDISDILPEGFLSRTKERGLIVPWAPQLAVLAHPSVGGFMTHCGWNSTLESLWMGVPMIGYPLAGEQRFNLRFVTDKWKVGWELEKKQDGSFTRDAVERAVYALMEGEEGKEVRKRASELREDVRKTVCDEGLSERNLQKFVEDMRKL